MSIWAQGGGFTGLKAATWKLAQHERKGRSFPQKVMRGRKARCRNVEVWKYGAIQTNGNCGTGICWRARRCLHQIHLEPDGKDGYSREPLPHRDLEPSCSQPPLCAREPFATPLPCVEQRPRPGDVARPRHAVLLIKGLSLDRWQIKEATTMLKANNLVVRKEGKSREWARAAARLSIL